MATISISIPDNRITESLDAACYALGYRDTVETSPGVFAPNPENKVQRVKRAMAEYAKALVERGARDKAANEAGQAAVNAVKSINIS